MKFLKIAKLIIPGPHRNIHLDKQIRIEDLIFFNYHI